MTEYQINLNGEQVKELLVSDRGLQGLTEAVLNQVLIAQATEQIGADMLGHLHLQNLLNNSLADSAQEIGIVRQNLLHQIFFALTVGLGHRLSSDIGFVTEYLGERWPLFL